MLLPHAIAVTIPPTGTPVSLAEAKSHLLVEHDLDDSLLNTLLKVATAHAQREANLYLMPQTIAISYGELCGDRLEIPVWPLRSLGGVSYTDADGASQTLTGYQSWLAHRPPLIAPAAGSWWPSTRAGTLSVLTVTAAVGFADATSVPEPAKHAIKLIVAHAYANKGDGRDPTGEAGIPPAACRFLDYLREDFYR